MQFEVDIIARDEAHAERKARELKLMDHEPTEQSVLAITTVLAEGLAYFEGSKVEHAEFGRGVIVKLHRLSDPADSFKHIAHIRFEGGVREVVLPMPSEKLKIINSNV
jgi:hypothetical protein